MNLKINCLRAFKCVSLVQLLPSTDTAGLDANHVLPPILWLKVTHTGRLVDPRVPDYDVVQVVANQAEALSAALGDYDGVLGALGWCIYTVRLAREVDHTSLRLCLGAVNLIDVWGVFETGDFDGGNILVLLVSYSALHVSYSELMSYLDPKVCMQKRLAFKWLLAVIGNDHCRRQAFCIQCNAIQQPKLVRPLLGRVCVNRIRRQAKI